jgi:hypothetical protein
MPDGHAPCQGVRWHRRPPGWAVLSHDRGAVMPLVGQQPSRVLVVAVCSGWSVSVYDGSMIDVNP